MELRNGHSRPTLAWGAQSRPTLIEPRSRRARARKGEKKAGMRPYGDVPICRLVAVAVP